MKLYLPTIISLINVTSFSQNENVFESFVNATNHQSVTITQNKFTHAR